MKIKNAALQLLLVAGIVALLTLPAAAQSDSALVQAAKQKSTVKARHVYTNEEIPESPQATAAVPAVDAKGGAATDANVKPQTGSKSTAPDAKVDNAKSESVNSADSKGKDAKEDAKAKQDAKLKELEGKLAQAKKNEQELQQQLDDLDKKASTEQSEFRRRMYLDMISNQQTTLSDYRRTQEDLQKQVNEEKSKSDKSDKAE